MIDVSVAPTQLDSLSSAILQRPGMAPVALPGNGVTWAAGHHGTLGRLLANTSATAEEVQQTRQRIPEFFHRLIARKRREPGDDLASALIAGRDNGELVSDTELIDMLFMVLSAGFVTTTGVIGNGVLALLTHPQQLHLVRSGQVPWPQAIEEIVRWCSSVANFPFRYATQDMDIEGCPVRRGYAVLMAFHAANRDEEAFGPGADRFDVTRRHNPHLSFGQGPTSAWALLWRAWNCAAPFLRCLNGWMTWRWPSPPKT
ncbi:cytochrome P450 [Xanthomonas populi]